MNVKMITGIVWEGKPGYAKVHFDEEDDSQDSGEDVGFTTNWLPMMFLSTFGDKECITLTKGTQVKCLMEFDDYSRCSEGVILGAVYNDEDTPPDGITDKQWVKQFEDGTVLKYDKGTGQLTADVKGNIVIKSGKDLDATIQGDATVKASRVLIDGDLDVTGKISAIGKVSSETDVTAGPTSISLSLHTHSAVQTGGGTSGPPVP